MMEGKDAIDEIMEGYIFASVWVLWMFVQPTIANFEYCVPVLQIHSSPCADPNGSPIVVSSKYVFERDSRKGIVTHPTSNCGNVRT